MPAPLAPFESIPPPAHENRPRPGRHREEGQPTEFLVQPLALEEIIACLKRVRKSINRRTRQGGRQGYLTFVSQFVR